MANVPRKVAVIGLDCAEPNLIKKHISEGHLATFKKFFENGVFAENCLVPYPTVTPPNWASIATGAWPQVTWSCQRRSSGRILLLHELALFRAGFGESKRYGNRGLTKLQVVHGIARIPGSRKAHRSERCIKKW